MLKNIAEKTGVSISTVSRALAGKPGVSAKKQKEILEIARKCGIMPSRAASYLRTGRRSGVKIIVNYGRTRISAMREHELINMAEKEFGYVETGVCAEEGDVESQAREAVSAGNSGIIFCGDTLRISPETTAMLRKKKIPFVSIGAESETFDSLLINRAAGTRQIAKLFIHTKKTRPVYFSFCNCKNPDDRLKGIISACEEEEAPAPELFHPAGSDIENAYFAARELFSTVPCDALFAYSDTMAIGALRAVHELGLRVPEDVSIAGMDGIPECAYLSPSLTTVVQPVAEAAREAINLLKNRLSYPECAKQTKKLDTKLFLRETTTQINPEIMKKIYQ
ncbi:MAG: LacI family DNA-binding transcriptional regulator [Fibrobacterota bacterium]